MFMSVCELYFHISLQDLYYLAHSKTKTNMHCIKLETKEEKGRNDVSSQKLDDGNHKITVPFWL